jgi:hypothetical protein
MLSIHVECYSGHTYAQEPRAFEWEGRRYNVERVVKRWRTPAGPGFRVEVAGISDPNSLISNPVDLTYLESTDQWTMAVRT